MDLVWRDNGIAHHAEGSNGFQYVIFTGWQNTLVKRVPATRRNGKTVVSPPGGRHRCGCGPRARAALGGRGVVLTLAGGQQRRCRSRTVTRFPSGSKATMYTWVSHMCSW